MPDSPLSTGVERGSGGEVNMRYFLFWLSIRNVPSIWRIEIACGMYTLRQVDAQATIGLRCCPIRSYAARVWRAGAPWYADCSCVIQDPILLTIHHVLTRNHNYEPVHRPIT